MTVVPSDALPRGRTLSAKLGAIGALLLMLALASIGLTLWVTWQLEGGAAAVNEAGRLRMQTWRLAQGVADTTQLAERAAQFDRSLALLDAGDPARPLAVPRDAATRAALADVRAQWQTLREDWLDPAKPLPDATRAAGRPRRWWSASTCSCVRSRPSCRTGPRC